MDKRIILCAGHGGGDSGATGQGTNEAAEVIDIVNRAVTKLVADGQVEVVQVPNELNLIDEINWVNERYGGLNDGYALEVHKNATNNAHGVEGWYFHDDPDSAHLMECIDGAVARVSGLPSRGEKPDTSNRWGSLGWVEETNTNAGLLECGFISDGGDPVGAAANDTYAQGIYEGVLAIWGLAPRQDVVVVVPPQVKIAYRVFAGAKQIGAYALRGNAWGKYANEGGTKIVNSDGVDVTTDFVNEFRPQVKTDTVVPQPDPQAIEIATVTARVSVLESLVLKIKELLAKCGINL